MSPCLLPYPPVRLPSQGIMQEAKFQSGPTPVIGKEEVSGEAPPLFPRNHPTQVFLKEKTGDSYGSSVVP